jgi:hypothetical protein
MTRRERRQLEEQGVFPEAFIPVPSVEVPVAQPEPLVVPPAAPMTRRERKMLEETGAIPIPPGYQQPTQSSALQDTSLVEVTRAAGTPTPPGPEEPLPPVFWPPTNESAERGFPGACPAAECTTGGPGRHNISQPGRGGCHDGYQLTHFAHHSYGRYVGAGGRHGRNYRDGADHLAQPGF